MRVGCWAHARRKFNDAVEERPKAANLVLRMISRLYRLEREWDETDVGARRAALRREYFARPLRWLRYVVSGLAKKGAAAIAAREGVQLPAQPLGCARGAPGTRVHPARQQSRRKRHPAFSHREEELALHRTPRCRPALRDHLLARRLLPAPRKGSTRIPSRCPAAVAGHVEPGRSDASDPGGVAAIIDLSVTTPADGIALRTMSDVDLVALTLTTPSISVQGALRRTDTVLRISGTPCSAMARSRA